MRINPLLKSKDSRYQPTENKITHDFILFIFIKGVDFYFKWGYNKREPDAQSTFKGQEMKIRLPTETDINDIKRYVNDLQEEINEGDYSIAVMEINRIENRLKSLKRTLHLNANKSKIIEIQQTLNCSNLEAIEAFLNQKN
tara:strand:+ start:762 stop:1184 length:423 start_codon:yes stop_codon:yes gene_type:complete